MINLNNYSIILLSAGIGKRLGKIGKDKPKCLLEINGKKLIEYLIENLQQRNASEISIILGYKSRMIIETLKKYKGIKFNFIKIDNYKKNGHACSWHAFKKTWFKKKLPVLLSHTDTFFNPIFIDNIIKSKNKNIIGIHSKKRIYKNKSILVQANNDNVVTEINFKKKRKKLIGEVIGLNKISKETTQNLFHFMDKFLVKDNKKLSWEFMLDRYIKTNKDSFFILKNQNFNWTNVNFKRDYLSILNK